MKPPSSKRLAAVLLAATALTLTSCGRRGPLEPPPGAAASNPAITGTPGEIERPVYTGGELPQQNAAGASGAAPAQAGATQTPVHPPKPPFPLDPLL